MTRALALVCALATVAAAAETHGPAERVAYIARALAALRATPPESLAQATHYAEVMSRSSCASDVERLEVECLMTASRQWCRKKGGDACAVTMDVVVAKLLGDAQLIPAEQRYQIMTRAKDWRHELERETRRLAGALAVDFHLRMGGAASDAELAPKLDRYCLAAADDHAMPWQSCVASLVWFIVTEGGQ